MAFLRIRLYLVETIRPRVSPWSRGRLVPAALRLALALALHSPTQNCLTGRPVGIVSAGKFGYVLCSPYNKITSDHLILEHPQRTGRVTDLINFYCNPL